MEITILWMKTGKETYHSCYRWSSRFDSVRSSVYRAARPDAILFALCSPSYCSAPQTRQTVAHRLMRDRHRRHILNRLRHHKNEDPSAVKARMITLWSIARPAEVSLM